jgi:hypothetical protein
MQSFYNFIWYSESEHLLLQSRYYRVGHTVEPPLYKNREFGVYLLENFLDWGRVPYREEVFMEGPLEPNMGPSLADVLLCTFQSTNAGFSSFPVRKLLS